MNFASLLCVLLLSFGASFAVNLPSSFTKCDWTQPDSGACLAKAIQNGLSQLTKDFKGVGLRNLDPLEIPELVIGAGSGPVAFQQNYKNMKLYGFKDAQVPKVEFDNDKKILKIYSIFKILKIVFHYDINGKILLLPITGNGPGTITLHDANLDLTLELEEFDKKGVKHFKVKKYSLDIRPKLVEFKLENLFNGDKVLGDNINQVFNDNWSDIFNDVKSSYNEAFGKIFASIFDEMGKRVSVDELFGKK